MTDIRHCSIKRGIFRSISSNATSVWLIVFGCLAIFDGSYIKAVHSAAVMSVDLGSEWLKVGVVSPGVPMEIALNRESKRKTPAVLAFRDGIRTFGEDAVTIGIREPAAAYGYLLDLLGKNVDNPIVDLYRKRFPYYNIIPDPGRNTVIFKRNNEEQFSVEELVAQILVKAKEFAQESTKQTITECVLTVPGYFGQAEREALLAAAQLANLKVLQLINDYAAVALNYGVFNRADINETASYYIFYDMGAYKTSAAVVSYQLVKDKQTKETNPVVQVLGVGYDRTLGGLEIQLRLRDYLAAEFNAMKKTKTDVTKNPRALAKLFKEAGRVKNVLSANNDHFAQIENLLEDHDFKMQVTREKLEELCIDMWPRVVSPIEQALTASGLTMSEVSQVILFGGGTRVPKVQEIVKQIIKKELGKSLNADEAATMGAVYKAADLATGFKVKKFIIKDAVIFPIQVTFDRDLGDGVDVRQIKRVLFGHMNAYPQKKVITFNKHTDDFDFYVHYGDLNHLPSVEASYIGSLNISRVELRRVKELLNKNQDTISSKGIKAYFVLDESGIFHCSGVEFVYEKEKVETDDEGTLAKLGSTISKLFSKESKKEEGQGSETLNYQGDADKKEPDNGDDKAAEPSDSESTNRTMEYNVDNRSHANLKNETVRIITVKEPVEHHITFQITPPLAGKAFTESLKKLNGINTAEVERNRLESAFNALESHVVEMQQKLGEDEYTSCLTAEEKNKILSECAAISEWLYEDIENPTPDIYENRLKELKKLTSAFMERHWEQQERPEALMALEGMLEHATKFLDKAKNLTADTNPDKDVFTNVEIEILSNTISDTIDWKKTEAAAQKQLKCYDDVRLTVKDIADKMATLDREVKYLINKIKIWKPKAKLNSSKKNDKKSEAGSDEETVSSSGGSGASGEDIDGSAQYHHEVPVAGQQTPTPTDKTSDHSEL